MASLNSRENHISYRQCAVRSGAHRAGELLEPGQTRHNATVVWAASDRQPVPISGTAEELSVTAPSKVRQISAQSQSPNLGPSSALLGVCLCLMLHKRFARPVLLLHQAKAPLAYFAVLPPEAITFLASFGRHSFLVP